MNLVEAINELEGSHHDILDVKQCQELCEVFGVKVPEMRKMVADTPDTFKGITLYENGEELPAGTVRFMMGAMELAKWICNQLGVSYNGKFGRGSQMRECCCALREHFKVEV